MKRLLSNTVCPPRVVAESAGSQQEEIQILERAPLPHTDTTLVQSGFLEPSFPFGDVCGTVE